ncbi:ATP-binding protein [Halosegnis longus]|uniref:ATP-binding protein n=1 Tax=Halosegnis longus TaxID=2216012 RepID=UPI00096A77E4|nr:ATP-binding protein [Salella cibi]
MELSTSAYEALLSQSTGMLTVIDETGDVRYQSPGLGLLGYADADLVGENVFLHVHPEDRERVLDSFKRLTTGAVDGDVEAVEYRFRESDGSWHWVESRGTAEPVSELGGYVVDSHSIEKRKAAEQDRSDILDRMTDGFFAVDREWKITYTNDAGREILGRAMGYNPETAVFEGRHLWKEVPEAVGTTFYNKYHQALKKQTPVTFEEYYEPLDAWLSIRTYPSEQGLSIYFRDITEQRQREQTLEHRERVLREMHTLTTNRDTSFTEKIQALLALGRDELGTEYGSLSHIDGDEYIFEVVDTDNDDIEAGDVVPVEATNCERVASETETLVAGNVQRDTPEETEPAGYAEWGVSCYLGAPVIVDGEVYGTFCFYDTEPREQQFSDWEVTIVDLLAHWASYELQREQTTERLTEQNRRLDRFASIVSHDLRNPLSVFEGRLEMARETGDAEHFEAAERALDRMQQLIEDLLSLTRAEMEIEETEPITLGSLADECWEVVATDDATLTTAGDVDEAFFGDRSRVKQLLENLLRNAVDHGGDDVQVRVGSLPDGFFIEDDGPGVPPDARDDIFGWEYSTREQGTGLGLSIVRSIAHAHGWQVRVTDSETGGARFEVTGVRSSSPAKA